MFRRKNHSELLEDIKSHPIISSYVIDYEVSAEDLSIYISNKDIYDALKILKDDDSFLFSQLTDLCGVDWPEKEIRFEVVYNLLSMSNNARISVKSLTDEKYNIKSVCKLFPCAEWYEREAFDLFGINFIGNKDLRRLLTDYGFEGHPLRKDFPLTGYVEVRYDDDKKRIIYEPVELKQEFRSFDFESPWEGVKYPDENLDNENLDDK